MQMHLHKNFLWRREKIIIFEGVRDRVTRGWLKVNGYLCYIHTCSSRIYAQFSDIQHDKYNFTLWGKSETHLTCYYYFHFYVHVNVIGLQKLTCRAEITSTWKKLFFMVLLIFVTSSSTFQVSRAIIPDKRFFLQYI